MLAFRKIPPRTVASVIVAGCRVDESACPNGIARVSNRLWFIMAPAAASSPARPALRDALGIRTVLRHGPVQPDASSTCSVFASSLAPDAATGETANGLACMRSTAARHTS